MWCCLKTYGHECMSPILVARPTMVHQLPRLIRLNPLQIRLVMSSYTMPKRWSARTCITQPTRAGSITYLKRWPSRSTSSWSENPASRWSWPCTQLTCCRSLKRRRTNTGTRRIRLRDSNEETRIDWNDSRINTAGLCTVRCARTLDVISPRWHEYLLFESQWISPFWSILSEQKAQSTKRAERAAHPDKWNIKSGLRVTHTHTQRERERERERETDRQTDIQTDRQTDRQTNRETETYKNNWPKW